MLLTAHEIYNQVVRTLPSSEQLRLATLILNELVQQNPSIIDQSDTWRDCDRIDIANFSMQYAARLFPEDEEIVE